MHIRMNFSWVSTILSATLQKAVSAIIMREEGGDISFGGGSFVIPNLSDSKTNTNNDDSRKNNINQYVENHMNTKFGDTNAAMSSKDLIYNTKDIMEFTSRKNLILER